MLMMRILSFRLSKQKNEFLIGKFLLKLEVKIRVNRKLFRHYVCPLSTMNDKGHNSESERAAERMIRHTAMEVHYDKRRNTIQFCTHNGREILLVKLQTGLAKHGINIYTLYAILPAGKIPELCQYTCGMWNAKSKLLSVYGIMPEGSYGAPSNCTINIKMQVLDIITWDG